MERQRKPIQLTLDPDLIAAAKEEAKRLKMPLSRWLDQVILAELERLKEEKRRK